ncbi:MAG: HDOD domain-containing protein [Vicinamibacterales bacterium]|nr:HDOD domain-containing protein [Vicinamibacterales bacterium]
MRFPFRRSRQEAVPADVEEPGSPPQNEVPCIARQPIFTMQSKLYGYDLVFRSPAIAAGQAGQSEDAGALGLTDALLVVGLDVLANQRRAFVTMPRGALVHGVASLLPAAQVVVGVSADVAGDEEALTAFRELKRAGYKLALRDCVLAEGMANFIPLADYVTVDGASYGSLDRRDQIQRRLAGRRPTLMATRVDSQAHYQQVRNAGVELYQGSCFGRVDAQPTGGMSPQQLTCLQLLQALNDPDLSMTALEDIIKRDAMLTYRLLRAVRSAGTAVAAGAPAVSSIRLALVLLGQDTVRRWASLWAVNALADQQSAPRAELVTRSIVRARCCELLDASEGNDGFLLGLCSLLDVLLGQPLAGLLVQLPLSEHTREALAGKSNSRRQLLECVAAYERGQWEASENLARDLGLDPARLPAAYTEAHAWARGLAGH